MTRSRETGDVGYRAYKKNYLINGNMDIWQRGDGPFLEGFVTADRWRLSGNGSQVERDFSSVGTGLRILGSAASATVSVLQFIEDARKFSNMTITMSTSAVNFDPSQWHYRLYVDYGTGGSSAEFLDANIRMDADGVATFTIPDLSGKTFGDNDSYLQFGIQSDNTPTDDTTIFYNVQLEEGSSATSFEYVSPAENLAACQRYYTASSRPVWGYIRQSADANNWVNVTFPVTMRSAPEVVDTWSGGTPDAPSDISKEGYTAGSVGSFLKLVDYTADAEL